MEITLLRDEIGSSKTVLSGNYLVFDIYNVFQFLNKNVICSEVYVGVKLIFFKSYTTIRQIPYLTSSVKKTLQGTKVGETGLGYNYHHSIPSRHIITWLMHSIVISTCQGGYAVMSICITFFTPPQNRGGVIFLLQFVCVCVCVCVCVRLCLWTNFQPNGCTDLDAVFTKWLPLALARTLLNLVTFGQRSRSQWCNSHFFFIIHC